MKQNHKTHLLLMVMMLFGLSLSSVAQIILEDSLENGNNYKKAAFRYWCSSAVTQVQGIMLLVPGSNSDGRKMADDPAWQELATNHKMALIACYLTDKASGNRAIESYCDVKNGSGSALLQIIKRFADQSGHPELVTAPLALWGMSAGGQFNYEFACWEPDRVIAFIVNKGGVYYSALAPPASRLVPGVFLTGERDNPYRNEIIEGIFSVNRRFGAKWIFAEEPGESHTFQRSKEFALEYFNAIIPLRLGQNQQLLPLPSNGLKLDNSKLAGTTSWIPNEAIEALWNDLK